MPLIKFDYLAPKTTQEIVKVLSKERGNAVIMAGGTDLLLKIRQNKINPKLIISLKNIKNMNLINLNIEKGLTIGATSLLHDIAHNKEIIKYYPTIAIAAKSTANTQIRNMGTVVGNICNASPSADNAPILIAMQAVANVIGPHGTRKIELKHFFLGPGITSLSKEEFVTSIFVPMPPANHGTAYLNLSQRGNIDCSTVGIGIMLTIADNIFEEVRIVISACGPTPMRAVKAEKILKGNKINEKLIHEASLQATKEMSPISDVRASATYRKKMIYVMSVRAINSAKQIALENVDMISKL